MHRTCLSFVLWLFLSSTSYLHVYHQLTPKQSTFPSIKALYRTDAYHRVGTYLPAFTRRIGGCSLELLFLFIKVPKLRLCFSSSYSYSYCFFNLQSFIPYFAHPSPASYKHSLPLHFHLYNSALPSITRESVFRNIMRFTTSALVALPAVLLASSSAFTSVYANECTCPPSWNDGGNSNNGGGGSSSSGGSGSGSGGDNYWAPSVKPIKYVPKVPATKENLQNGAADALKQLTDKNVLPPGKFLPRAATVDCLNSTLILVLSLSLNSRRRAHQASYRRSHQEAHKEGRPRQS